MNTPSFALVCRLQLCEVPFVNEFLAYYRTLGVDRFFLVNTEPENGDEIRRSVAGEFAAAVTHLNNNGSTYSADECAQLALSHITETYTLHLDLDEFLYLGGRTLHEFVAAHGQRPDVADAFLFRWVMAPCIRDLSRSSIRDIVSDGYLFPGSEEKTMAKTAQVERIGNHRFDLKMESDEVRMRVRNDHCFVLHVATRGLFDLLNKIATSRVTKSSKAADVELSRLFHSDSMQGLPGRFYLHAFQSRFGQAVLKDLKVSLPELSYATDTARLEQLCAANLSNRLGYAPDNVDIEQLATRLDRVQVPSVMIERYLRGRLSFNQVIEVLRMPPLPRLFRLLRMRREARSAD
ncbi:MAG: glycosyltransferase family 2 protein [Pseudomonadota bacterium]